MPHEHDFEWNEFCSAHVCTVGDCAVHKGLERCWCGWSLTSPGRGYQELIEMGERIEPED